MSGTKSYIDDDGEAREVDEQFFREGRRFTQEDFDRILRPGRPALPEDQRKARVTMYLDRDLLDRLKADGKGWQTRANAALRKALGLP